MSEDKYLLDTIGSNYFGLHTRLDWDTTVGFISILRRFSSLFISLIYAEGNLKLRFVDKQVLGIPPELILKEELVNVQCISWGAFSLWSGSWFMEQIAVVWSLAWTRPLLLCWLTWFHRWALPGTHPCHVSVCPHVSGLSEPLRRSISLVGPEGVGLVSGGRLHAATQDDVSSLFLFIYLSVATADRR